MEDTKRIRFSNMAKFMFNEDQAIIFNRLNGQWIKVPKQCYDILELCNKEGLSWSALSESLADDEDREYMKQLIKLLDSMNCLYNDIETEGGGVRLPPSFLKNDGNASIWIKKLLYL